jgi:hypothetical protein
MPFDPPFVPNPAQFPNLHAGNHTQTSPVDTRYNCFAWAMGEQRMVWDPSAPKDAWWPIGVPRVPSVDNFVSAFATRGYRLCPDGNHEEGFEKISISVKNGVVQHAARRICSTPA